MKNLGSVSQSGCLKCGKVKGFFNSHFVIAQAEEENAMMENNAMFYIRSTMCVCVRLFLLFWVSFVFVLSSLH